MKNAMGIDVGSMALEYIKDNIDRRFKCSEIKRINSTDPDCIPADSVITMNVLRDDKVKDRKNLLSSLLMSLRACNHDSVQNNILLSYLCDYSVRVLNESNLGIDNVLSCCNDIVLNLHKNILGNIVYSTFGGAATYDVYKLDAQQKTSMEILKHPHQFFAFKVYQQVGRRYLIASIVVQPGVNTMFCVIRNIHNKRDNMYTSGFTVIDKDVDLSSLPSIDIIKFIRHVFETLYRSNKSSFGKFTFDISKVKVSPTIYFGNVFKDVVVEIKNDNQFNAFMIRNDRVFWIDGAPSLKRYLITTKSKFQQIDFDKYSTSYIGALKSGNAHVVMQRNIIDGITLSKMYCDGNSSRYPLFVMREFIENMNEKFPERRKKELDKLVNDCIPQSAFKQDVSAVFKPKIIVRPNVFLNSGSALKFQFRIGLPCTDGNTTKDASMFYLNFFEDKIVASVCRNSRNYESVVHVIKNLAKYRHIINGKQIQRFFMGVAKLFIEFIQKEHQNELDSCACEIRRMYKASMRSKSVKHQMKILDSLKKDYQSIKQRTSRATINAKCNRISIRKSGLYTFVTQMNYYAGSKFELTKIGGA